MAETVQLIRGKSLEIFRTNSNGLSARDAIRKVGEAGRVIASNARIGKALAGDEYKSIKAVFPCWTGTMTAYVEPGTAFNKSKMFSKELQAIVYTDPETKERWIFPVGNYRSEKNAILVSEHPDYSLEINGKEILVKSSVIDIIPNFPEKDGWYLTDPKHGIPVGSEVGSDNPKSRHLWRVDGAGRVGPVARGCGSLCYGGRGLVLIGDGPSVAFEVAVEAPEGGAAVEAKPAQITVTVSGDTLTVKGTPEQLKAVLEIIKSAKRQT